MPPERARELHLLEQSFLEGHQDDLDRTQSKPLFRADDLIDLRFRTSLLLGLTGYTRKQLESILEKRTNIEAFISKAKMNPSRTLVTGAICGVRVEEIEDTVMQGIRYPTS